MAIVYSRSLRRWHGTKAFTFDPINFRSLEKEGIFSLRSKLSIVLWKKRKTGEITLKAFNNVTRKEGNKLSITRLKTEKSFLRLSIIPLKLIQICLPIQLYHTKMFMSTEDNFLFSHFPGVIYMTINVKLN